MIKVKVMGVEKVLKNSQVATEKVKKILKKELIEAGLLTETDAKMELTQKEHVVTGRLRASIHTEYNNKHANSEKKAHNYNDLNGKNYSDKLSINPKELEVLVGTNVVYAKKIERLDPYIFPSSEKNKQILKARIKNALKNL